MLDLRIAEFSAGSGPESDGSVRGVDVPLEPVSSLVDTHWVDNKHTVNSNLEYLEDRI